MRCMRIILPLVMAATAVFGTTITVLPSTQNVNAGDQAVVSLSIAGLGDGAAPSVGTLDIDIAFDPTILAFNAATFGNQLDILGLGDLQFVTPGLGTVNLFELSLDSASDLNSLQAPAFLLATVTFDTIGTGTSQVQLSLNALGDADGNNLHTDLSNGSVTVAPVSGVPEPSTVGLTGLALVGLLVRRIGYLAAQVREG